MYVSYQYELVSTKKQIISVSMLFEHIDRYYDCYTNTCVSYEVQETRAEKLLVFVCLKLL